MSDNDPFALNHCKKILRRVNPLTGLTERRYCTRPKWNMSGWGYCEQHDPTPVAERAFMVLKSEVVRLRGEVERANTEIHDLRAQVTFLATKIGIAHEDLPQFGGLDNTDDRPEPER